MVKLEKVNNKEYVQKQNMMSLKEKKAKRETIKRHEEVGPHDHSHWTTPTGPAYRHSRRSMS